MKKIIALLILMSVALAACVPSGGDIPATDNAIRIAETSTVEANSYPEIATVSAVRDVFNLDKAIEKMPEFYADEISDDLGFQYISLVSKLPESAQRWITSTGQFLQDKKLDVNEESLLNVLISKEDPLFFLTMPQFMDDVTDNEVTVIESDNPQSGGYAYLKDDIEELEQKEMLSGTAIESLKNFILSNEDDYEMIKGFYLINHFGKPKAEKFI